MEGLLTVLVIWGLYKLFFSSSKPAQAPINKRRSSYTKSTTTSARSTKPSPSIKKSSYSEKYKKSPKAFMPHRIKKRCKLPQPRQMSHPLASQPTLATPLRPH